MSASGGGRGDVLPPDARDEWASLDAAARDAAYNNNAAVADSAKRIEQRNRNSAAYRSAHPKGLDVTYAVVTQKPLTIAFGSAELPTLVHDAWGLFRLRSAAGAPGRIMPIAGADHFSILSELQRANGVLVRAAIDLVQG